MAGGRRLRGKRGAGPKGVMAGAPVRAEAEPGRCRSERVRATATVAASRDCKALNGA